MDNTEICYSSAGELASLIKSRQVSPREVVEAHLERIEATEPTLNSFITVMADQARAAARQCELAMSAGTYRGPLHGVPLGLKDLYYVRGVRNTSGSRIFDDFVPDYDCTVANRFRRAGAVLIGKLNLHQFAFGPTGENPDYGNMHNPWNVDLIPGGSSGGSGSAAAAGQCTITMGSDTGGSIRIPSALCGLAGLKPTYGRISRYGISVLAWSLDHAGPMCRTVEDCALVMNALAGYDPMDPASVNVPVPDFTEGLTGNVKGLRIGVPKEYFEVPVDTQVEQAVRKAIEQLGEMGAEVREVSMPMFHQTAPISTTILYSEATAYHRNLVLSKGAQYAAPVRVRIESGFFISGEQYLRAQRARALFTRKCRELFDEVDVLAGPMEPMTAHPIGATQVQINDVTVGSVPALTQYTRAFNLNGFPAITVPCGFSDDELPIGLQLAGKPFDESTVLRAAHAYEKATDWHKRRPPV